MAKKIVAIHKKTGSKYVTCVEHKNKNFYEVQTLRGFETKTKWTIRKIDIEFK